MKRIIMTMVAMVMMITSVSAQRIDNSNIEARILTDKMTEELGLNSWQREKAYQMNLSYLNGISSYRDIDSQGWKKRNNALKGILNTAQWRQYKNASYFYRPISWRNNTYVHNIYAKYPGKNNSFGDHRVNKPVTLPAPPNQRPVEVGRPQQPNYTAFNKNSGKPNRTSGTNNSNRSFGSMRR